MTAASQMPRNGRGNIAHVRRPFVSNRPVHVTHRVRSDVGSLRKQWIMDLFRELVADCRRRGLRVLAWVIMSNHVHVVSVASRRADQTDGLRYLFGKLARAINASLKRRGKVFVERYYSVSAKTARHAWQLMGYVLRNPTAAGLRPPAHHAVDPWLGFQPSALDSNAWLIGVFGPRGTQRRALLLEMTRRRVPWRRRTPTTDERLRRKRSPGPDQLDLLADRALTRRRFARGARGDGRGKEAGTIDCDGNGNH